MSEDADGDLDHHETEDQAERDAEFGGVGVSGHAVGVPTVSAAAVGMPGVVVIVGRRYVQQL